MLHCTKWLVPWMICLAFAAIGCAGKKIVTQPKAPADQAKEVEPITIEANPRVTMVGIGGKGATVNLTIVIDPNPENNWVEWSWDSEDGDFGRDRRSLSIYSEKKFRVQINLSPGEYEIEATLSRGQELFSKKATVSVVETGSPQW